MEGLKNIRPSKFENISFAVGDRVRLSESVRQHTSMIRKKLLASTSSIKIDIQKNKDRIFIVTEIVLSKKSGPMYKINIDGEYPLMLEQDLELVVRHQND